MQISALFQFSMWLSSSSYQEPRVMHICRFHTGWCNNIQNENTITGGKKSFQNIIKKVVETLMCNSQTAYKNSINIL